MLYIKKQPCPSHIQKDIQDKTNTTEWQSLPEIPSSNEVEIIRNKYFDKLDKDPIRIALVSEQHGLCAYCMDRITPTGDDMVIEHWYPLSQSKSRAVSYNNLLASCRGGDDGSSDNRNRLFCCDKKKGGAVIQIDPQNKEMMESVRYLPNGVICIDESYGTKRQRNILNQDINQTLCLNGRFNGTSIKDTATQLVRRRKDIYQIEDNALISGIEEGTIDEQWIKNEITNLTSENCWEPFTGVKLFVLQSYLEKVKV